jgi:ABC-type nitrate/sulfonate/bicarbonate transport system ATPase subunit
MLVRAAPAESAAPVAPGAPKIALRGVTKRYDAGVAGAAVLAGIDLAVAENEFVTLVGRSGCGKTTLLNIVAGLLEASAGEVLVDGAPVTGPGRGKGVVFQNKALFPWLTARRNVAFGARSRGLDAAACLREADELLALVGLAGSGERYPAELSGGMQQRVAIARALAQDPQILLMDEPFGALDEITRIEMQDELLRVWSSRRKTVLFVTHSITEALALSDRVVVMGTGRIAAEYPLALPRPRSRADPRLAALHERIWEHLR